MSTFIRTESGCDVRDEVYRNRLSSEEFHRRIRAVHGDRYDFSGTNFRYTYLTVSVTCRKHGQFFVRASYLMRGVGCPDCKRKEKHDALKSNASLDRAKKKQDAFEEALRSVFGDRYRLMSAYQGTKKRVVLLCAEHGRFSELPKYLLAGQGCLKCDSRTGRSDRRGRGRPRRTKEAFVEAATLIHGFRYDYSESEYCDFKTPVTIRCPIHGTFSVKPSDHTRRGSGCPSCQKT